jgi:hypothetical protein
VNVRRDPVDKSMSTAEVIWAPMTATERWARSFRNAWRNHFGQVGGVVSEPGRHSALVAAIARNAAYYGRDLSGLDQT